MEIYFSCSLTGGRKDTPAYQAIVNFLLQQGLQVPTQHLAHPEVMDQEHIVDPFEVFQRDINWLESCDGVVAEVSTPSHGVGYEIAYALCMKKPVLCCYRKERPVSKMLTGNTTPSLRLAPYSHTDDLFPQIADFLTEIEAPA